MREIPTTFQEKEKEKKRKSEKRGHNLMGNKDYLFSRSFRGGRRRPRGGNREGFCREEEGRDYKTINIFLLNNIQVCAGAEQP